MRGANPRRSIIKLADVPTVKPDGECGDVPRLTEGKDLLDTARRWEPVTDAKSDGLFLLANLESVPISAAMHPGNIGNKLPM